MKKSKSCAAPAANKSKSIEDKPKKADKALDVSEKVGRSFKKKKGSK